MTTTPKYGVAVVPGIREPGRPGPGGVPERTRAMTLDPGCIASVTRSLHCGVRPAGCAYERVLDEF
jgi:hypothetical protein